MAEYEADLIRLSLPADDALSPVVEVTMSVIGRRLGRSDDDITAARADVASAIAGLSAASEGGDIAVEIRVGPQGVTLRLQRGADTRALVVFDG